MDNLYVGYWNLYDIFDSKSRISVKGIFCSKGDVYEVKIYNLITYIFWYTYYETLYCT